MKVYIVGSKGIPAAYGGFETFADRLVSGRTKEIQYIVTGMSDKDERSTYNGASTVQFNTKNSVIGRMVHMFRALRFVLKDSKTARNSIVYVLGCRAGIILPLFRPLLKHRGVKILVNPDGAEWKRAKWNFIAKTIVLVFEHLLVRSADVVVCDSQAILTIMRDEFHVKPSKLKFIAYGSDVYDLPTNLPKELLNKYENWMKNFDLDRKPYYLMVGRFVPENNFELVIREFMKSYSLANLVVVSNVSDSALKDRLENDLLIKNDKRIKLVGTLYDQDVLKFVRSRAAGYIHGHEVGGTNPSLLEALGSTNVNLVYGVNFNREVAQDTAYYFDSTNGNLASLIERVDTLNDIQVSKIGNSAKERIKSVYSWSKIIDEYERLFLNEHPTL